jgi:hypothetical protein
MAVFLLVSYIVAGCSNWMLLAKSKSNSDGSSGSSSGSEDTIAQTANPDKDCAFTPSLDKCEPDLATGKYPSGFSVNVD